MHLLLNIIIERKITMKTGKLDWDDLNKIIKNSMGAVRNEVKTGGGIGEDCSIVSFGEYDCVLSTDPITGAAENAGKLAVNINCNDVASSAAEPLGILVTILAPQNVTIYKIQKVMNEIHDECKKLNVEVLGGHTEVTAAVNKMIISCTVLGRAKSGRAIATSNAQIGDDIIVTKNLCIEGTSILVNDYPDKAKSILTEREIEEAKGYVEKLSVVKEGIIAGNFGVNCMHDITEGGVLGALWEVASASEKGFIAYKGSMPLSNVTRKLCKGFGIDPLRFISSGSMLITSKHGHDLLDELEKEGINASIIGKITDDDKKILADGDIMIQVTPPQRDELFAFMEKAKNDKDKI